MKKVKAFLGWCWRKARGFWPWYKGLYKGRAWYTKTLIGIVSFFALILIYLGAVDINFLWLFGKSPGYFSGIMDPPSSQASEIYSADGVLIGKYFNENRTPVKYEEINPDFFKALVDTEDERYYKRPRGMAVDVLGIFASVKDAILRHDGRGASTISQQLAKNMFRVRSQYSTGLLGKIPGLKILIVKSKEWIIATKLETVYNKRDIITMYANTVDFGNNAYGIKTASKTYFGTSPDSLSTQDCAVLVGMLKATTMYNPKTNPENSKRRRNVVLTNMYSHGDLTKAACDSLKELPIELHFKVEENYDGQAMYFREAIADYLKDWCEENGYDLYSSGLKIYTTLDTRMQKYAEQAAMKQMKQVQNNFNNHWGIFRNQNKNWMRMAPWRDENGNEIPGFIDQIAERQPGSTFKLFVYTEAMNQGLTPCDKRRDEYISMQVFDKKKNEMVTWTPGNANGSFSGDSLPLKSAFAKSINSIAVRLGQEMGIKRIIATAQAMGIKSPLDDEPSLALGSSDVQLLELTDAYCTVANNGMHHDPVLVTRIVDKDGKEVYADRSQAEQVIPYKSAFLMQQMLMGGMREPGGTSMSLWGYVSPYRDTDFGGKTGTSNNHSDAWFECVSPKLVVGAWVGGEYRSIHFRTGALGQGSRTALPITGYFMQALMADPAFKKYHGHFRKPTADDGITNDMYVCQSYYAPVRHDTTRVDSTRIISNEEVELGEDGEPINKSEAGQQPAATDQKAKATEKKAEKKHKPTEEQINLDNL